jgi:peptidyl-prolyl cis-trans isomerase C
VNGQPVRLNTVFAIAKTVLKGSRDQQKDMPGAVREAMWEAIGRELLLQEALARGVKADDQTVEHAYDLARLKYPDEKEWNKALAADGLDPQAFQVELRAQQTIRALVTQEEAKLPPVTEAQVRAYYASHLRELEIPDRVRLSHILVRVPRPSPEGQRQEARQRAERILERVRHGEDFEKLARELSEDDETSRLGGRLPETPRGVFEPDFEAQVFALRPGQVSGVIESRFGFHIVRLEEKIPGRLPPFEEVKDAVRARVSAERYQETMSRLENELRAKARIETYL